MKYNGTLSKIQQNKYTLVDCANMGQFTYYINPLMTVSTQEYTKHYFIEGQRVMSRIGAGMANNLMDMEDGAYDYIMSALSDSIKNQLAASFECLSLDGIAVFNTSIEPILEMANQNNHEFLRYFYHPDHLGSSSFITDATGEPTQHLEYLPFGELFIEERSTWNTPYKFSGKELDDETGYSYFGARYYDPNISIWLSVDPMAHLRSWVSPYSYCQNNPIGRIDPTGALDGDFISESGKYLGNDGINDGKVYIVKTTQTTANINDKHENPNTTFAGITTSERDATESFIRSNSGNTTAFQGNDIAYRNSVEIIGDAALRQGMVNIVNQDNGKGLSSNPSNNHIRPK